MDQIDLKLLKLLQQRTKLSGEIGRAKRRHGADIYVPARERELFARVSGLAGKTLPPAAVTAIFREILSSSRAAQGQEPIGLLRASADEVLLPARWQFGACDRFGVSKSWRELFSQLAAGRVAVALLTLHDLAGIFRDPKARALFDKGMSIVAEFSREMEPSPRLDERIFVVKAEKKAVRGSGNRVLILIECKIKADTVKSLLIAMPQHPLHAEYVTLSAPGSRLSRVLMCQTLAKPVSYEDAVQGLKETGHGKTTLIVGIYPSGEDYVG